MNKIIATTILGSLTVLGAACASNEPATNRATTSNANAASTTTANTATTNTTATTATTDDTPAAVRAALPDAQSFTTQHKDIPAETVASIEKETGTKIADIDHHSYLAFSTAGGARRQIGAATIVEANGQEMVVVYDSKEGSPVIREVRGSGVPSAFLAQFAGKGHDDPLTFGKDITAAGGTSEATAKTVTTAIKRDVLAMQALYGSAHSH